MRTSDLRLLLSGLLGVTIGLTIAVLMGGCGGQSNMQAKDAAADHHTVQDAFDALDATTDDDAGAEPGSWPWVQEGLVEGFKARRLSWPSGFYIRMEPDGTYRSSSNGGATFTAVWTPATPADETATDWMVY